MPYIKLNSTAINRSKENVDRFILVSSVVNSPISPEDPKLITSIEDLDLYFEKDFSDRDYFIELIDKGVGLFLYKPINPEKIASDIQYDYEKYNILGENKCYLTEDDLPLIGLENTLYLSKSDSEGPWIWVDGLYYDVRTLPQNLNKKTKSINIRDSLRITEYGSLEKYGYNYCYPRYVDRYKLNTDSLNEKVLDLDDYFSGHSSFSYILKIKKDIDFDSKNEKGYYISFTVFDETYLIWFSNGTQLDPIGSDYIESDNKFEIRYMKDGYVREFKYIFQEILDVFIKKGYTILEQNETDNEIELLIYTDKLSPSRELYNLPGFSLIPDVKVSNQILSDLTKDRKRIDFYSKAIGNAREKIKIKISQVRRKSGYYTIEVSKYDYTEVFTGSLFPDLSSRNVNEEMLDTIINRDSKIITCDLKRYRDDGSLFKVDDPDSELYVGEWTLLGAEEEVYNNSYYLESLETLKTNMDFVEDFLMIPNIDYYRPENGLSINYSYFPEYEILLDYAKSKGCQVLIDNIDTEYKILSVSELPKFNFSFDVPDNIKLNPLIIFKHVEKLESGVEILHGYYKYDIKNNQFVNVIRERELCNDYMNNFIFNYNNDKDNYLIYFYRKITLPNSEERPGFYVFLDNIITGKFETKKTRILYNPPVNERFLIDNKKEQLLLGILEKMKSNYLSYNNHYYYYDQLFEGDSSKYTSIITRFLIGKIRRRIEAKKWNILNETDLAGRLEQILSILYDISYVYYNIIKNITITKINESNKDRKLSLTLKLTYIELINRDIYINITINT